MEDEDNVLFVRGAVKNATATADDVWDDTALIKAYDKAVNLAKSEVVKRMGMEIETVEEKLSEEQNHNKQHRKWTVGSPCRAVYSADHETYEAIIVKIYENHGTCIVKFVGYGNTEKVELCNLEESEGLQSQIGQQKIAAEFNVGHTGTSQAESSSVFKDFRAGVIGERMDYESARSSLPRNVFNNPGESLNLPYGMMPTPPPIPPQLMAKLPDNDSDALSSMLMSWYMSGFHTGYYHGIKQARYTDEKRKK